MERYILESIDFTGSGQDLLGVFEGWPHVFLLDSSRQGPCSGRYSFVGLDPFDVFSAKGPDALSSLRKKFMGYAGRSGFEFGCRHTPLAAGMVGCLGYDFGRPLAKVSLRSRDDLHLPDFFFGFYDCILTVDHMARKLFITSCGLPEKNPRLRRLRASQRMAGIRKRLDAYLRSAPKRPVFKPKSLPGRPLTFKCNFSREDYQAAVTRALAYIGCGDIYQVNLSQRFELDLKGRGACFSDLYGALRTLSPSFFGGYFDGGSFQIMSNSPERFLCLRDGVVQAVPMKGTRPRGDTAQEDRRYHREILNSAKEKAELLMITDLLRNDLGRVCAYGSVRVKIMRAIEKYPYVFQATSTVEGALDKGRDCFDLIRACFPGGSITGCPKIRAMEIIEELEPTRRAMYTGSMGYINFAGNMDLNILIRTLLAHRGRVYFQVGAGIVADSVPEKEYEEIMVKARALRECLELYFNRTGEEAVSLSDAQA